MKQKINMRLMAIAVLAVLATTVCITFLYYALFRKQVKNDLRISAELIQAAGVSELVEKESVLSNENLRITWIDKDGTVLFDNDKAAAKLRNHSDRPEVQEAFATGMGESVRISDTMNMNTFYYALKLEDGTVVRVCTQAQSIFSVFFTAFPVMGIIIVMIVVICILISHLLTKQLLKPIEATAHNLQNTANKVQYKELVPFVNMIRQQHEDILAAARSRQDFTANVSHELKTPLAAISGYAELIENHMIEPDKEAHIAKEIHKNADRLLTLINDIIRLSELDHNQALNNFEQVDLYEIVSGCMEALQENARQRNVTLELAGGNCELIGNREMLVELVENLCQNAIRYNVQGGTVRVCKNKDSNKGILTVADTGIGIPRAEQERIFERFYRVDKSRSRETGGTGLGLAIVKHIVELHGAKLFLDSEPDKGTTVTIEFMAGY
jgi:two-component system phosphate regulon sensor histidine kinase PhoR